MKEMIAVFIGGGLGSLTRYTILRSLPYITGTFPAATFTANLLSCLLVGILIALFEKKVLINPLLSHLLVIGFCGGFSTFSTFIRENHVLMESGKIMLAIWYTVISVFLGVLLLLLGIWLGKLIIR